MRGSRQHHGVQSLREIPDEDVRNLGVWMRGAVLTHDDEDYQHARKVWDGLAEGRSDLARAAFGENYDRLCELEAGYDPEGRFQPHRNITVPPERPTRSGALVA